MLGGSIPGMLLGWQQPLRGTQTRATPSFPGMRRHRLRWASLTAELTTNATDAAEFVVCHPSAIRGGFPGAWSGGFRGNVRRMIHTQRSLGGVSSVHVRPT